MSLGHNFFKYSSERFMNHEQLHTHTCQIILDHMRLAETGSEKIVIGLSGGFSYIPVYRMVREVVFAQNIKLDNVVLFLTDDVYGPSYNDPDANSHKYILQDLPGVTFLYPRVDTLDLDTCIKDYNEQLQKMLREKKGRVDLVTLEMGEDGHIAGLFPPLNDPSIHGKTEEQIVINTKAAKTPNIDRISVSMSFLMDMCDECILLLKGESRLSFWKEMYQELNDKTKLRGDRYADEVTKRWPVANLLLKKTVTVLYDDPHNTLASATA